MSHGVLSAEEIRGPTCILNGAFIHLEAVRAHIAQLWVCMAPRTGRRNLVCMALRAFMGRVTDHELNAFEAEEILVQAATPRVNVSTDGEVSVMDAPLHYRIRPRALGVVVPARNGGRS
jgi:diacylglycerol kinase family enzyme